jgi:hypothetical protein
MLVLGEPLPPCPAAGGGAARDGAVCMLVATVDAGLSLQHQQQQQQCTSVGGSISLTTAATSAAVTVLQPVSLGAGPATACSVLDSLMNIHSEHEQQQQPGPLPVQLSAAAAAAQDSQRPSSSSQGCAHLCVLSISLQQVLQHAGSANGLAPQLAALGRPSSSSGGYNCALPLPHQPQPTFLAAARNIIAVGSSTLAPLVTLVRHSRTAGLQLLQSVEVPLPLHGGDVTDSSRQVRLQGLLQLDGEGTGTASSSSSSLVELLALLAVTDTAAQGPSLFAGLSSSRSHRSSAADVHLVKLAVELGGDGQPGQLQQQEQQQHVHQHHHQQRQQQVAQPTPPGIDAGSQAVVAAIQALQASLEHRLDALCHALKRTEGRLQALERRHGC